jgi:hypothetical protein
VQSSDCPNSRVRSSLVRFIGSYTRMTHTLHPPYHRKFRATVSHPSVGVADNLLTPVPARAGLTPMGVARQPSRSPNTTVSYTKIKPYFSLTGKMAEWLWRVTQASTAYLRYKRRSILMGQPAGVRIPLLSCIFEVFLLCSFLFGTSTGSIGMRGRHVM